MTYKSNNPILPFWAENGGFVRGRDPLGIQNSSITVYGRLLPGMTNLTGRIRYYSFYCWLLNEYDKLKPGKERDSHQGQYDFIRKAELVMAFLMMDEKDADGVPITNVVGSNYVARHQGDAIYNLAEGIDKNSSDYYWEYRSGALGQYYAGSLISLDLIEIREKYFHIKDKGRALARAFGSVVEEAARRHFLELISNGHCSNEDLDKITPFRLNNIVAGEGEWNFLEKLLLEEDGDNFRTRDGKSSKKRLESINLFLQSKEASIPLGEFPLWVFSNMSLDVDSNSSRFGWFYYYLNEAVHYSLSTIFWAFLSNIEGQVLEFDSYLQEFNSKVLHEVMLDTSVEEQGTLQNILLSTDGRSIPDELSEIKIAVRRRDTYYAAGKAALLLTVIYNFVRSYKEKIREFELNNYIENQKGHLSQHLCTFIEKNINISEADYIDRVVKTLLNDHMSTAYRKMGNGEANLLKFLIEERCIVHIETIDPQGTNPRTQSLRNFMLDLGYIDSEEHLTALGIELLSELRNGRAENI